MRRIALVSLIAALLVACNDTTGPSDSTLSGSWDGSVTDSQSGTGTLSVSLSQSGQALSGTWQVTYGTANGSGNLTGAVNGANLALTLEPTSQNDCTVNVTATVTGSTMSGNYSMSNCSSSGENGTLKLTRQ